ncbi:MAG: hypothetical protein GC154_10855 [bacterium]|nr:hypothetical protein [bacterium]
MIRKRLTTVVFAVLVCALAVPAGWSQVGIFSGNMDIDNGRLGAAGSTTWDPGTDTYTVSGSGDDVWNEADAFQYAYVEWSGDFVLSADVDIEGGLPTQDWIKSMMMARQDLTPGSVNVTTRVRRDGQFSMQWRTVADDTNSKGSTDSAKRPTGLNPSRQRLTRIGDTFITEYLNADREWVEVDRHDVPMTDPIYVGLGVTAHDTGEIATGHFTGVSLGKPIDGPMEAHRDIGVADRLGAEGDATYADGVYTVMGSGDDVWNEIDNFHYAFVSVRGNFTLIADVAIEGGLATQDWIKSMLMARQNLSPGSVNVTTRVRRDGQFSMQWRTEQENTDSKGSTDGAKRPTGLNPSKEKLERQGNTYITSYMDANGEWVEVDRHDVVMVDPIFVGLGVTAHDIGQIATGTFSNIELTSTGVSGSANWELFR